METEIEQTNFLEIAGNSPNTRLMDFLIENDRDSWTLVEIKNQAGVGYSTLKELMPKLLEKEIVMITKKVGKSNLFRINKDNPIVKRFYALYDTINKEDCKKLQKSL